MSADGFYFDVGKWFGSVAVQRMSFTEKGVYLTMMFQEWRALERSLPDDPAAVAELIAVTPAQAADVAAAWDVVRRKFATDLRTPGRIVNLTLEKTRRKQLTYLKNRSTAGKLGGKRSAANKQERRDLSAKHSLSTAQANPTDLIRVEESRSDQKRVEIPSLPPRAGKQAPLQLGLQRFKVWRWMLEDCIGALGEHADTFDLDAFIRTLDQRETRVVPEVWPWLRDEVIAEARRRNLPIAGGVSKSLTESAASQNAGVAEILKHRAAGV